MSKVQVDSRMNPGFVLYNIVFGSNNLPNVNPETVIARMREYGVDVDEKFVKEKLKEYVAIGMIRIDGDYYVA